MNDPKKQFTDINLKLNALNSKLPQGAGPIQFNSDFGDTAALMLTVASPPASDVEIALRARSIREAIEATRAAESANVSAATRQHCVRISTVCFCRPWCATRFFRDAGRRAE